MPRVDNVSASEWRRWTHENGAIVLDVREPAEWATGTLPGSVRMSLGAIPAGMAQLDPETPILVVCRSGNRSRVAAKHLAKHGYRTANLAGGIIAVQRAS